MKWPFIARKEYKIWGIYAYPRWIRRIFCLYPAYKHDSLKARLTYSWGVLTFPNSTRWRESYFEAKTPGYKSEKRFFFWCNAAKFWLLERKFCATPRTWDKNTRPLDFREPSIEKVIQALYETTVD